MKVSLVKFSGDIFELDVEPTASVQELLHHARAFSGDGCVMLALSGQIPSPISTLAKLGVEAGTRFNLVTIPQPLYVAEPHMCMYKR